MNTLHMPFLAILLAACGGNVEVESTQESPASDLCAQISDVDACNAVQGCVFAVPSAQTGCYTKCPDGSCGTGYACERATAWINTGEDMNKYAYICVRTDP